MADDRERLSWWVGLSRDELHREIEKRVDGWQAKRIGMLDNIGARLMRDAWDLQPTTRRSAGVDE